VPENLEAWTVTQLKCAGLAPRELQADKARVPAQLKRALPLGEVKRMMAGEIPAVGFGIAGDTGGGKSMCLASMLRGMTVAWAQANLLRTGAVPHHPFRWVDWPSFTHWLKAHAIDGQGEERVMELMELPLVVLDDIGRERIKGDYTQDWSASQLDRIVSHRYRHVLPILYTLNLDEEELGRHYGGAMVSRLLGEYPLVHVPGLPDLRIRGGAR
jgi:DNA replication protein DnaC